MQEGIRARIRSGERLLGTLVTLPSAEVAELLAEVGFDWLFIDTEHGAFDALGAQPLLQAISGRCAGVIRVPVGDDVWVKKALDIGADGIIVPQVNSATQARRVVAMCRYPPQGTRGVGVARAHGYGLHFQDYLDQANDQVAVIVQAEHVDAVEDIENIVQVEGIDCVLVGPYDLSASLGRIGEVGHPEVQQAIAHIRDTCLAAGIPLGAFGVSAEAVEPFIAQGFTFIAVGIDTLFLCQGAQQLLGQLSGDDGS